MSIARPFIPPRLAPSLSSPHTSYSSSSAPCFMAPVAAHCTSFGICWLLYRIVHLSHAHSDELLAFLGVVAPPAPVVTVREIRDTTLNLYWQLPGPAPDAPLYVVAGHLVEIEGSLREEIDRGETSVNITELEPDKKYRVRVWAVGAKNRWRTPSEWVMVRTAKAREKKGVGGASGTVAMLTQGARTGSVGKAMVLVTSSAQAQTQARSNSNDNVEPTPSSSSSTNSSSSSSAGSSSSPSSSPATPSPTPTTIALPLKAATAGVPSTPTSPVSSISPITDAELALVRDELAKIRVEREEILRQILDLEQHHRQQETSLRQELARLREMKRSDVEEPRTKLKARVKQLEEAKREAEAARGRAEKEAGKEETARRRIEEQVLAKERDVENLRRMIRAGEEAAEEATRVAAEQKEAVITRVEARERDVEEAKKRLEDVERGQAGLVKELEGRQVELAGVRARNKELEAEAVRWEERGKEREKERVGAREKLEALEREQRELAEKLRMVTREKMTTMEELGRFKKWKEDQEIERRTGIGVMSGLLMNGGGVRGSGFSGGGSKRANAENVAVGGGGGGSGLSSSLFSNMHPDRKPKYPAPSSSADLLFPIVGFSNADPAADTFGPHQLSPSSSSTTSTTTTSPPISAGSSRRASISAASPSIYRRKGHHTNSSPESGNYPNSPPSPSSPLPDSVYTSPQQRAATSPVASLNGVPVLRPAPSGSKRDRHMIKGASNATLLDPAPGPPARSAPRSRSSSITDSGFFEHGSPSPPHRPGAGGRTQRQPLGSFAQQQQPGSPPLPSTHPFNHPNGGHHLHHKASSSSLFEHDPLGDATPTDSVVVAGRARSSSNPIFPFGRFEIPPANPPPNPVHRSASSGSALQRPGSSKQGPGLGTVTTESALISMRGGGMARRPMSEYSLYSSPIVSSDGPPPGIVSFVPPWIVERTRSASLPSIGTVASGHDDSFGYHPDGYAHFANPAAAAGGSYWPPQFPRDRDRDRQVRSFMSGMLDDDEHIGEDDPPGAELEHPFVHGLVNGGHSKRDSRSASSASPGSPMLSSPAVASLTDAFSPFYRSQNNHHSAPGAFSPVGKKRTLAIGKTGGGMDPGHVMSQLPVGRFAPFAWEEPVERVGGREEGG
ncbi:hypothetical protein BC936DRAFT_138943 [Jimgerdemannia flammicorona]|uniref:Uncharacterized protein n=2 Tax=Jimgerdemannia flammicorona TaxID=994334 RepID=A0A433BD94_9FUNG|nr:hypothetical protein BC936DRAFT_138943 [Jimgerdemannia flammicorona]RUS29232.1 hypothetical protein BC938DRAFT_480895 [Jimgerdemannia flammicorona]